MLILEKISIFKSENLGDLPDGLMVKTLCSQCTVTDMIPGQATETLHATWLSQKIKQKKEFYID